LASVIGANERLFGVTYPWSDDSRAVAANLDFVARAPELARHGAPTLLVVGADDDAEGFARPAKELAGALINENVEAAVVRIPDMGHAIADEPGLEPAPQRAIAVEPAPQRAIAAAVDGVVSAWLRQHLS
jgi:pimeloyl-ACP methyl ester carboxylesterase